MLEQKERTQITNLSTGAIKNAFLDAKTAADCVEVGQRNPMPSIRVYVQFYTSRKLNWKSRAVKALQNAGAKITPVPGERSLGIYVGYDNAGGSGHNEQRAMKMMRAFHKNGIDARVETQED